MKILLDTHVLLWAAGVPERLSPAVRSALMEEETEVFFSTASLWEIAIKQGLGRSDFQVDVRVLRRGLLDNDYRELAITGDHAVAVTALPILHKDPFDRLLVAQATVEGITLWTADAAVAQYPGPIRRI